MRLSKWPLPLESLALKRQVPCRTWLGAPSEPEKSSTQLQLVGRAWRTYFDQELEREKSGNCEGVDFGVEWLTPCTDTGFLPNSTIAREVPVLSQNSHQWHVRVPHDVIHVALFVLSWRYSTWEKHRENMYVLNAQWHSYTSSLKIAVTKIVYGSSRNIQTSHSTFTSYMTSIQVSQTAISYLPVINRETIIRKYCKYLQSGDI